MWRQVLRIEIPRQLVGHATGQREFGEHLWMHDGMRAPAHVAVEPLAHGPVGIVALGDPGYLTAHHRRADRLLQRVVAHVRVDRQVLCLGEELCTKQNGDWRFNCLYVDDLYMLYVSSLQYQKMVLGKSTNLVTVRYKLTSRLHILWIFY